MAQIHMVVDIAAQKFVPRSFHASSYLPIINVNGTY